MSERDAADNAWLLSNAFVILTMQAGFGMLEAGMVSAKATSNILMKNLGDLCYGAVFWFISGFALAYGDGNAVFGTSGFFLHNVTDFPFWVFQFAFAATASTILSGAVAGRMRFMVYLALSSFVTGFAYPFAARWAWHSDGWLGKLGYYDFAGCGPIHLLGGVMGMVGTWVLGPRLSVFTAAGQYCPTRSSPVHCMFGTFILWYAWMAFNGGSSGGLSDGNDVLAGRAAANSAISSGMCTIVTVWMSFRESGYKTVDVFVTTAGSLSGLVAITAPCGVVEPWEAAVIGATAALVTYKAGNITVFFKLDDPVGVFPVHVVSAVLGLVCVGLFARNDGLFHGGGFHLLGVQVLGVVVYTVWGVLSCLLFVAITQRITPLRVDASAEVKGLDEAEHDIVPMKLMRQENNRRSSMERVHQEQVFYTKTELNQATSIHQLKAKEKMPSWDSSNSMPDTPSSAVQPLSGAEEASEEASEVVSSEVLQFVPEGSSSRESDAPKRVASRPSVAEPPRRPSIPGVIDS